MEADEHDWDSTFGGDRDSVASSSTSLTSAVTKYRFEHGRRYHAYQDRKYLYPNDDKELDRMDLEHHNQKLQLDGRLFLCPLVEDPKAILDLGTGSGIWCIEMADLYPDAQVIGTDLSPVQPSWVPTNCRFEVDDFDQERAFGSNRFDMIHHRFLGHVSDYSQFYKRAFDALKPGGSIECVDIEFNTYCDDGSLPEDSALYQWSKLMNDAFTKMGKVGPTAEMYKAWLEETGFENVHLEVIKRPSNDWPRDPKWKEVGRWSSVNFIEGMEAFTLAPLTRVLGWKVEEAHVLLAQMRKEWVKQKYHAYHKGIVCYGTRPLHTVSR